MSELIRPTMSTRVRWILNDTDKFERIRRRELEKDHRDEALIQAKTTPLPFILPRHRRDNDEKCGRCDARGMKLKKLVDRYCEPVDAFELKVKIPSSWEKMKAFVMGKFLNSSMQALVVHPAHVKMLKNIQKQKMPKIFVISQENAEISILSILYILWISNIELPLVTVNESLLRIPIVGRILTDMGVTTKIFSESEISEKLHSNENFIVQLEKDLSTVLAACEGGRAKEVLLVPVSLSCEKRLEDFRWKFPGCGDLGLVKMNFHEPYSSGEFTRLTDYEIREHLEYDMAMKRTMMSTHVVAFLMLTELRTTDDLTVEDVAGKLEEFRAENDEFDFGFEGEAVDVVKHALNILGEGLVGKDLKIVNYIELSRYAEVVTPHFFLKSSLLVAARHLKQIHDYIDYNELIEVASKLKTMFMFQKTITKPCFDVESQLNQIFDRCSQQGIMSKPPSRIMSTSEQRATRLARHLELSDEDDDDDSDEDEWRRRPENEITLHKSPEYLINIAMPILDAYLTGACMLKYLVTPVDKDEFIKTSVKAMSEEIEDGRCHYPESCDPRWAENFIEFLYYKRVVEIDGGKISLNEKFNNSKGVKTVCKEIEKYFV